MGRKLYFGFLALILFFGPVSVWLNRPQNPNLLPAAPEPPNFITNDYQIKSTGTINTFTVSGQVQLNNDNAFARVILVDANQQEYLVYENYSALTNQNNFRFTDACEETCSLNGLTPDHYRIESENATLVVEKTNTQNTRTSSNKTTADKIKIDRLNQIIKTKNNRWQAGETSVSKLTYAQKKKLFGLPVLPNLQGFEFYKGGIFEIEGPTPSPIPTPTPSVSPGPTAIPTPIPSAYPTPQPTATPTPTPTSTPIPSPSPTPSPEPPSVYTARWDWRKIHGQNWLTPVRNQLSCGSCWAFAGIGVTETQTNLYYNQHLDIDLAEQDSVCLHPGSCTYGGYSSDTFSELQNQGLVTETCYPYTGDETCSGRCNDWQNNLWKISQYGWINWPYTSDSLKHQLISKGPFTFGIYSWWHVMTLAGYETDSLTNQPIWIVKNSWGPDWGEAGYGRLIVPESDRYHLYFASQPYPANTPTPMINCVDQDNDHYCSWGISPAKPTTCPVACQTQPDCDDTNPQLGPYTADYSCQQITASPTPKPSPSTCPQTCIGRFCLKRPCRVNQ